MSASPSTPIDYIAAGYWQDFLADRAIAGGIAYESELRDCILDESLASLQRVDTLLSQIRRDLIKRGYWDEAALLIDERYRNLMVFLAFYAGRVLAQQWQHTPHWYGQFELGKRYPELALITDDFYQHMAVVYRDDIQVTHAEVVSDNHALFFALEPIGLRLFGHIDRQFIAVQGGEVASGLYQAVSARLPNANHKAGVHVETANAVDTSKSLEKASLNEMPADSLCQQQHHIKPELAKADRLPANSNLSTATTSQPSAQASPQSQPQPQSKPSPKLSSASKPKTSPTPEMFTQLLTELDEIEVVQSAGQTEYQQACIVLMQFEQYIAKQNKPRSQIVFSEKHVAAKKQALLKLQASANAGNTAAMLRLAMYELLDEGLDVQKIADTDSTDELGAEWVKKAAGKNDSRAQRLLSKMYYQGVGVAQDIDNGKYWLEQAAENGHVEAASVVSQWQQAQALITTQKQEQHSIKRYQMLLGAVLVVAILIFIIV